MTQDISHNNLLIAHKHRRMKYKRFWIGQNAIIYTYNPTGTNLWDGIGNYGTGSGYTYNGTLE